MASRNRFYRGYFTMASEDIPWKIPAWRKLNPQAQALFYALAHGPYNGRSMANLTTGINVALIGALAAILGRDEETTSAAMQELEQSGLAMHDWELGLTLLPGHVWPADNASHVQGIVNRVHKKLPDSPLRAEYVRLLCRRTRVAAKDWEKDGEAAEQMLTELEADFPDVEEENPLPF